MKSPRIILVTVLAALVGAGAGAAAYSLLSNDKSTTVVRQVQVTQPVEAANTQPGTQLTVGSIYKLANRAVVKITVTSGGGSPFSQGSQQAQGSGYVYDTVGHVITNEHVTDGATSIKVLFWNGKT